MLLLFHWHMPTHRDLLSRGSIIMLPRDNKWRWHSALCHLPSVCLSVTRMHQSKAVGGRIMQYCDYTVEPSL